MLIVVWCCCVEYVERACSTLGWGERITTNLMATCSHISELGRCICELVAFGSLMYRLHWSLSTNHPSI